MADEFRDRHEVPLDIIYRRLQGHVSAPRAFESFYFFAHQRGDADTLFGMPTKDYSELKEKKFYVAANPISNGMFCVELIVTKSAV